MSYTKAEKRELMSKRKLEEAQKVKKKTPKKETTSKLTESKE